MMATNPDDDDLDVITHEWFIEHTDRDRIRVVIHEYATGQMTGFALLQERYEDADWKQVSRIDTTHGVVHVHHRVNREETCEDLWPIEKPEQIPTLYYMALDYLCNSWQSELWRWLHA